MDTKLPHLPRDRNAGRAPPASTHEARQSTSSQAGASNLASSNTFDRTASSQVQQAPATHFLALASEALRRGKITEAAASSRDGATALRSTPDAATAHALACVLNEVGECFMALDDAAQANACYSDAAALSAAENNNDALRERAPAQPVAQASAQPVAPAPPEPSAGSKRPDDVTLPQKQEPKFRKGGTEEREGERYARLLAERRLPDTAADGKKAEAALIAFTVHSDMRVFGSSWDDLAMRVHSGELKGAPHLKLIESFVHQTAGRRLGIMERNARLYMSSGLLANDLAMARIIGQTNPDLELAERAHRVAAELVQRLMPDAKRETTGYEPEDGAAGEFEQGLKVRYTADVGSGLGPTLMREIVIPSKQNKTYIIDSRMAESTYDKHHYALGPNGEELFCRVTRLLYDGEEYTLPLTTDEVKSDNAVLVRVGSPLAPKDVVLVDSKVISFKKRYAGDVLSLMCNLHKLSYTSKQEADSLRKQLVLYIFEHIAAAMEQAHAAGVINRDIKPEHMLYHISDPPTLSGYNLAYVRPSSIHAPGSAPGDIRVEHDGTRRGSAGYMAQEIVCGGKGTHYDQKVDVFSFGASLAYMTAHNLEDVPYFQVNTPRATNSQHGMHKAVEIYENWRRARAQTGSRSYRIDWQKVFAGKDPLDRQARSMYNKVGESFANIVFDMLFPDPTMRPSAAQIAATAKSLARSANIDCAALSQLMLEAQKYNRRASASRVALDNYVGRLLSKDDIAIERQAAADLLSDEKHAVAEPHLRAVVLSADADAEDNFKLAAALDSQGRREEAFRFYMAAIKLNGAKPEYKYLLGAAYKKEGYIYHAADSLREAVETVPADDALAETYAEVLAECLAEIAKREAEPSGTQDNVAKSEAPRAASDEAKKTLRDSQRQWQLGVDKVKRGDDRAAEAHFRQALKAAPDNVEFNFSLGLLLQTQQRNIEAEAPLRKAADLEPNNGAYNAAAGVLLRASGNNEGARLYLKRAADSEPRNADNIIRFGYFLLQQKEYEEAAVYFRNAVALDSGNAHGHAGLGEALGFRTEATTHLLEAVRLDPTNPAYRHLVGLTYKGRRQFSLAKPYLREAVRLDPETYAYRVDLHNCLFDMGRTSDAKKVLANDYV